jgi:hypothetical protein
MTEAWLLLDETAIRRAAGNPRGQIALNLPNGAAVERLADPKEALSEALRSASELTGRRLKMLRVAERRHRVAELMDWQLLQTLPAFQLLERELVTALVETGWREPVENATGI